MVSLKLVQSMAQSISVPLARGLLVALVIIGGLQACSREPIVEDSAGDNVERLSDESLALAELVDQPISFKGAFVEAVSDSLFLVDPTDLEPEGLQELGPILVINRTDLSFRVPADENTPIWVLGEVQTISPALLAELDLTPEQQAELEGQAAVIAESITLAPAPEDLVENANAFLNQPVTVFGNVELTDSPDTLVIENPGLFQGRGIVAIAGAGAELFEAVGSDRAAVSGVLRSYVLADLEQEYELTWDLSLQEEIEAEFEQSPVIIASEIYPIEAASE